jgi:hypothetical protein
MTPSYDIPGNRGLRNTGHPESLRITAPCLAQAESSGVAIEQKPFTGEQSNLQETSIALQSLPRNSVHKRIRLQDGQPNSRKILTLAHYVGAQTGEIACFLLRHGTSMANSPRGRLDLHQGRFPSSRIFCYPISAGIKALCYKAELRRNREPALAAAFGCSAGDRGGGRCRRPNATTSNNAQSAPAAGSPSFR